MATSRIFNLSAGPAILPPEVFERAATAVRELKRDAHADDAEGIGMSLLEISHRSPEYEAIHDKAIELIHSVLGIPRTHRVLLLQGGASLQFAMLPLNCAKVGRPACYVHTGEWSKKAIAESKAIAEVRGHETRVLADAGPKYDHIPAMPEVPSDASYVHVTSNNTIFGTEWEQMPAVPRLIVDASSNIGSRPMGLERAMIGYAGAQKNLGPSGVTLVWMHEDALAEQPPPGVPIFLRYGTHAEANSLYNTPNTFGTLVLKLVLEWLRDNGGVEGAALRNQAKADAIYTALDTSSLYAAHAKPGSRSRMNVTWTLAGAPEAEREAITKRFVTQAEAAGFSGIKGHRSVGGCRASIYNAFPLAGVQALCEFMQEFERKA
jgi:phosphoserine aminotransferase